MDIFKGLFNEIVKETGDPRAKLVSSFNDKINELLSGEDYTEAIQNPLNDKEHLYLGCQLCGFAPLVYIIASDRELESLTPEVRERVMSYLAILRKHYNKIIDMTIARVNNTVPKPKTLEEMSREELLEYIKQKFNK